MYALTKQTSILIALLISIAIHGQTGSFYKETKSGHNFWHLYDVELDLVNATNFITGGFAFGWYNFNGDTLLNDSYLIKSDINGQTKWIKKYHVSKNQLAISDVKVLKNKDILLCGTTFTLVDYDQAVKNGFLILTDSAGNIRWSKFYRKQEIKKIVQMHSGAIALLARDSTQFAKVVLLDSGFNFKWAKFIYTLTSFSGNCLLEQPLGSIVVMGQQYTSGRPYFVKFDTLGNKLSQLILGYEKVSFFARIDPYFDDGFYVSGTRAMGDSVLVPAVIRLDNDLHIRWNKNYWSDTCCNEFYNVKVLDENKIAVFGFRNRGPAALRSVVLMIDSTGNVLKSYPILPDSVKGCVNESVLLKDGRLLFSTGPASSGFGISDTIAPNFCSRSQINFIIADTAIRVFQYPLLTFDGGYHYANLYATAYDATDLKLRYVCSSGPEGILSISGISGETLNWRIYPNPANEYVSVQLTKNSAYTLMNLPKPQVFNALGMPASSLQIINTREEIKINTASLPSGVYFLRLTTNLGKVETKKFVISNN